MGSESHHTNPLANRHGRTGSRVTSRSAMTDPVADKETCSASFRGPFTLERDASGTFRVRIERSTVSVHEWFDEHGLETPAWTFGGTMPGNLIEVRQDQAADVSYENHIPLGDPTPFEAHIDPDEAATGAPAPAGMEMHMHHGAWIPSGLSPAF